MAPRPPEPSRFVRLGARRLHYHPLHGPSAAPLVVFDAALGGSSLSWVHVERGLAGVAPMLTYDRAGLGWSDAAIPAPPTAQRLDALAADLAAVLADADDSRSLLLVGHSFGALVVSRFSVLHPERVAGLVLVDPPSFGDWLDPNANNAARLAKGILLSRRGTWLARCGVAQAVAWLVGIGALQAAATCARWVSGGRLRTQQDFNFTPATRLPPEFKPAMRWMWSRSRFYQAMADQMEALPDAVRQLTAQPPSPEIPTAVLSAADTPAAQLAEHAALAARVHCGLHLTAATSGHWIPLEDPELVIQAVQWALNQGILKK